MADLPNFKWSAGSTYHLVLSYVSGAISTARTTCRCSTSARTRRTATCSTRSNGGSTWTAQDYEPTFRIEYAEGGNLSQPYASYSAIGILGATRYGQQIQPTESVYVQNLSVLLRKDATVSGDTRTPSPCRAPPRG